jgi:hypothetical protein
MKTRLRIALGACVASVVAVVGLAGPEALLAVPAKGKIINTQKLLNPVWNEAKDAKSNRYYFMEPASTVPSDVRVLRGHFQKEVCIAITGDQAPPPRPGPWSVKVEGGRTSPVTFVVGPGEGIEFANKDPWDHALYAVDEKAGFGDATLKAGGQPRTWVPPGPGKYELRDKLFPSVRSWIVVSDKPVLKSVFPTRKGDIQTDLDAGNYTLQAYHNGEKVGEALSVTIKPGANNAEVPLGDLKVGPTEEKKDDEKKDEKKPDEKKGG